MSAFFFDYYIEVNFMCSVMLRSGLSLLLAACFSLAHAADCVVPAQIKVAQGNTMAQAFNAVFTAAPAKGVDCGSIASVWQKLALRGKTGGRKLEADAPLDMNEARRQLQQAQRDPAISARLAAVQRNTSNPVELAILQAAILDEEGLYTARDARVADIAINLTPEAR